MKPTKTTRKQFQVRKLYGEYWAVVDVIKNATVPMDLMRKEQAKRVANSLNEAQTKKESEMAKTKEEKRKAWRDYAAKNRGKYLAWSRGWRSTEKGPTYQEFNKQYEAERKAKREAAKNEKGPTQPRKKS